MWDREILQDAGKVSAECGNRRIVNAEIGAS